MHSSKDGDTARIIMNHNCYNDTNMNTNMNLNTGARKAIQFLPQTSAPPQPQGQDQFQHQQSQSVSGIGEDFERNHQRMAQYEYGYIHNPHGWVYDPYYQNSTAQPRPRSYHGHRHRALNPSPNPSHFGRRSNSSQSSTLHSNMSGASPLVTGGRQDVKANGPRPFQHGSRSVPSSSNSLLVNRFRPNEKHFVPSNAHLELMARPDTPYPNINAFDENKGGAGDSLGQGTILQALLDITNYEGSQESRASNGSSNLNPEAEEKSPSNSSLSFPPSEAISQGTASSRVLPHNLKRNVDDLDSVSSRFSSSPTNSGIVSNLPSESDQDTKRQRSSSSISSISANDHGKQDSMLHLLCEATEIVSMRSMGQVVPNSTSVKKPISQQNIPSPTIQHLQNTSPTIANGPDLKIHPYRSAKKKDAKSCNCPRSRCIKLYCECFQAGRYCSSDCCCKKCLNLKSESGPVGKRTFAIQNILSRNPFAFHKDKDLLEKKFNRASGLNCRCVKSQCLKLYCDCFQSGKVCGKDCMCVKCLNTAEESGDYGEATKARSLRLSRNPNAFKKKEKKTGEGCSCKNSKCLKKYCDCFNNGLSCTSKCSCRDCQNYAPATDQKEETKVNCQNYAPATDQVQNRAHL